jgi:hypothetical protein
VLEEGCHPYWPFLNAVNKTLILMLNWTPCITVRAVPSKITVAGGRAVTLETWPTSLRGHTASWFNELTTDMLHGINMVNKVRAKLWAAENSDQRPNAITINNASRNERTTPWFGADARAFSWTPRPERVIMYEHHVFSYASITGLSTVTEKCK